MRIKLVLVGIFFVWHNLAFAEKAKEEKLSDADRYSYALGYSMAMQMKNKAQDINLNFFLEAITDGIKGNKPRLSKEEIRKTFITMRDLQMKKRGAAAKENKVKSAEFLKANALKKDVIKLPSGLQYKVVTTGKGEKPGKKDTVEVHYKGTLIGGKEFDSSYRRKQPLKFKVGGVIKGWQEILPMMNEGSKYIIYVPANLAYGPSGNAKIGPNEMLIFEIELLKVVAKVKP